MSSTFKHIIKNCLKLLVIPGVSLLISCENDIEKIKGVTDSVVYPDISGKNLEIVYSDSAKVRIQIFTDEIKKFTTIEKPYFEFPKGMKVLFFNDTMEVNARISADYAIYYTIDKRWEARGNVVCENLEKGETLYSEELFWDEEKEIIYSNIFSRIENKSGTFYGQNGFEADQNLTHWKLKGSRGTVNIEDKPSVE